MENQTNQIAEKKAEAISKIANSVCFIVITDNGKEKDNLNVNIMLNNPITALEFIKLLKVVENAILNPKGATPPPSSIIKP